MISSPGSAIARIALKNAMLPPASTTNRLSGSTAIRFSACSLASDPLLQFVDARDELVLVIVGAAASQVLRYALGRFRWRAVADHPLSQRDRARMLANPLADDRNHRRLDVLHALERMEDIGFGQKFKLDHDA